MRIALRGHQIIIAPPQRLAMIEVTRVSDGFSFKILHESGYDVEDIDVVVLPPMDAHQWRDIIEIPQKAPVGDRPDCGRQFPLVDIIDVRQPPQQYRSIPNILPADFEFTVGQAFTVSVIGQEVSEGPVIGE